MLHLVIISRVRADDLRSQSEASREELKLHRLQQGGKLRGDGEPAALFLHLRQEGWHLTQGLQTQLITTKGVVSSAGWEDSLKNFQHCNLQIFVAGFQLFPPLPKDSQGSDSIQFQIWLNSIWFVSIQIGMF